MYIKYQLNSMTIIIIIIIFAHTVSLAKLGKYKG